MAITRLLASKNVNLGDEREMDALLERMFTVGLARVKAEGDEFRRRGFLASQGNLPSCQPPFAMERTT